MRTMTITSRPARGYSLIELVVVVAILGVLMSLGVPMFGEIMRNSAIRARAETVLGSLQQARSEALKRNATLWYQLVDTVDDTCALNTAGPYWIVGTGDRVGACAATPDPAAVPMAPATAALFKSAPRALNPGARTADGVVIVAGSSQFCISGLGQLTGTNCTSGAVTGPTVSTDINITMPSAGACRTTTAGTGVACMRVSVRSGGQVRMCDPAIDVNGTDSRRCIP